MTDLVGAVLKGHDDLIRRTNFPVNVPTLRCGVSGGADSTALLVLAAASARETGQQVVAVHVDHGIRSDGIAEAVLVEKLAKRLRVEFELHCLEVGDGSNLEARARHGRLAALGPDALTGHTADDRAEWVLIALMRGSGIDGLAAMNPATRPLLGLRRHETSQLCAALGLAVVDDPHNHDHRFVRVRVRQEVLPLLDDVAGRDVVPLLSRLAATAGEDGAWLDAAAEALDPTDALALSGGAFAFGAACCSVVAEERSPNRCCRYAASS